MGVLVGTSLIVIIPEGIDTLYSANLAIAQAPQVRRSLPDDGLDIRWTLAPRAAPAARWALIGRNAEEPSTGGPSSSDPPVDLNDLIPYAFNEPPKTPTEPGMIGALNEPSKPDTPAPSEESAPARRNLHAWVGISLILGFILMYLIDTLPSLAAPSPPPRTNIYSLAELASSPSSLPAGSAGGKAPFSTTLGLVIHAAADGIALGASATQPALSFVVFAAILVHKAPAAFGLTTVLLKQGLGKRQARAHLLAFSLAAPAGALGTWMVLRILGSGGAGDGRGHSMAWWTGVILLFSGGTFL